MKFTYINVDGNIAETEDLVQVPENLTKIGNTYFEKKKETKKSKEVEPATIEEIDKLDEVNSIEAKALEFLKEKKVRGCHLLKWQKIIDKAVELWFIS